MQSQTYPYIRAWCRMMGSNHRYTEEQVARAQRDRAPVTATHVKYDRTGPTGTWSTFEDITDHETKRVIIDLVERMGL